jgi:lipopolysaccharide/colanic/teichoic acid biosynthesis glycosyltransferase
MNSLRNMYVKKKERQTAAGLLSPEHFRRSISRERARADRNDHQFSVVVLQGDGLDSAGTADLIKRIARRIRIIDEIGWFDVSRIGLILPYTSASGARTLAESICHMVTLPPKISTYTYPGEWLPLESAESGSPFDNDGDAKRSQASSVSAGRPETLFDRPTPDWKRAMDIVVSATALLILSPLFAAIAMTIALVSPGPVFLRQKRIGYQGRSFTILKFRTMKIDADISMHQEHFKTLMTADAPLTKLDMKGDPRIIPLGNLIRRCYLDELPQLINVLRGDMSLVGPRPCMAFAVSQYRLWQRLRCDALPGMTGLWQVSGKNKTTFKEMIRFDISYVRHCSPGLDLRIILKTFPSILSELMDAVSNRKAEHRSAHGGAPAHSDSQ